MVAIQCVKGKPQMRFQRRSGANAVPLMMPQQGRNLIRFPADAQAAPLCLGAGTEPLERHLNDMTTGRTHPGEATRHDE